MVLQVKLRASINKSLLNGGEQHLQLPKKGLPAQQIISSLEKRVGFLGQALQLTCLLAQIISTVILSSNHRMHCNAGSA